MISLKQVSKTYHKNQSNEVLALKPINLNIRKGEFVTIIGSNGSGKSTLLNVIAGEILPSSGRICIKDEEVQHMPAYKRSQWIAKVFQNPYNGTAADLSIIENFRLASLRSKTKGLNLGIDKVFIEKVKSEVAKLEMNLEDKLYQKMGNLSGGQRQALTMLMCNMDQLDILLLDEPTAALDPRSAQKVLEIAQNLNRELQLTILLVTHQLKDAYELGNRLIQMEEGNLIRDINENEKQKLTQNEIFNWFT